MRVWPAVTSWAMVAMGCTASRAPEPVVPEMRREIAKPREVAPGEPSGMTGEGSLSDGLESGGVAPALGPGDAAVLDAVHASNHPPPPPRSYGPGAGIGTGGLRDVGSYNEGRSTRLVHVAVAASATEDDHRLLEARRSKLRRCYGSELAVTPGLEGTLAVEVRRDANGETFSATATGVRGGPFPTAFVACVEDAVVGAQGVASGAPRAFRFNLQVSPY